MGLCRYCSGTRYDFLVKRFGVSMAMLLGYLRHYRRWNGLPGLTLNEQKALVYKAARDVQFGKARYRYFIEEINGESERWPRLQDALQMADDHLEDDALLVIPTLDGVQFNCSFLETLLHHGPDGRTPIYVCSVWRRPKWFAEGTNYRHRAPWPGWMLTMSQQADDFDERIVGRARARNTAIGDAIRNGLHKARRRGVKLGAARPNSYRFTREQFRKGGRTSADKRRRTAQGPRV
jgi:hypothetical protein